MKKRQETRQKNGLNQGITLIALVITIIVLLILAGISIALLTGENGIIKKAMKAKEEVKKAEYLEELIVIGDGLQPDRVIQQWNNQSYMNNYEEQIRNDDMFKEAQDIRQLPDSEKIKIQVIVKEGWVYWVTEDRVRLVEKQEEPPVEISEVHVSLKGNTLTFCDNEESAKNEAETYYGDVGGSVFKRTWSTGPDTPWYNDRNKIQTINFETPIKPINMACYFSDLSSLTKIENIQNLNTENVTSMFGLFYNCTSLKSIDVSTFNTENVETMDAMFYNCAAMTSLVGISNLNTSKVTNMNSMLSNCTSLTNIDITNFDMGNVTEMAYMFSGSEKLQSIRFPEKMDTSKVTTIREMFCACKALTTLNLSNWNVENVTDMCSAFSSCVNLESIDISNWNTRNVTDMSRMFKACEKLVEIKVPNFDTSKVTNMEAMFAECKALTTLDLSTFDTSKVTTMNKMFYYCTSLQSVTLTSFNTENVTDMSNMFRNCEALTTLDLSQFKTLNVTDMSLMFVDCKALTTLDLSTFDTSKVTTMYKMFYYCTSLQSVTLTSFNTENVTDMYGMFHGDNQLITLDLSSFNTRKVTDMSYMFGACSKLTKIYVGANWELAATRTNMFTGCGTTTTTTK